MNRSEASSAKPIYFVFSSPAKKKNSTHIAHIGKAPQANAKTDTDVFGMDMRAVSIILFLEHAQIGGLIK